jgi:hypothetical protein
VTVLGDNHMHDAAQAAELWEVSKALTKDYLLEIKRPDWDDFQNGVRKRSES